MFSGSPKHTSGDDNDDDKIHGPKCSAAPPNIRVGMTMMMIKFTDLNVQLLPKHTNGDDNDDDDNSDNSKNNSA
jgi:hypothetical protein